MPPPVLKPYNPWGRTNPMMNPFKRDASGRNAFEDLRDQAVEAIGGTVKDVKTAGGLLPGETGAVGDKTRRGVGPGWDVKSVIVYGIAFLFIFIGISAVFKAPQTILAGVRTGTREGVRRRVYRATSGSGKKKKVVEETTETTGEGIE